MNWVKLSAWPYDFLWLGCELRFPGGTLFDAEHVHGVLCEPRRYGVLFELYGVNGPAAGRHLAFFPAVGCLESGAEALSRQWLLENWDARLRHLCSVHDVEVRCTDEDEG